MNSSLSQSLHNNMQHNASSIPQLPPNLQQDLVQVFTTLQSSLYVMFLHYKPHVMQYENYVKLAVLAFFVYLFYKFGGMTVTDRVESQKQQLKSQIQRKNFIQEKVPKEIQKIKSNTLKIIILAIVSAGAYAYAFYTGYQQKMTQLQTPMIIFSTLTLCYLIYSNISRLILSNRLRQITKLQQIYSQKLNHFTQSLGPKVVAILRHHLCRDTLLKFSSSRNINDCHKQECKELRSLMKQKNETIALLVEETVDFEWCSICKKKLPFNQHLHFETLPYLAKSENETQQIKSKLEYLIEGFERIRKWLAETSPCNCSKLYWTTSTNQVIEFKKAEKLIDAKIKELTHRQQNDKV